MNLKNDLSLAFKPKNLSMIMEGTVKSGIKFMSFYMGIWLIAHIILALVNGLIDGKSIGSTFLFTLLTGLSVAVLAVLGILIMGVVGAYCSKLFKATPNLQKSVGLVAYAILPIFIINIVRDVLLFLSTLGGHFLSSAFTWINLILFIITLIWIAWFVITALSLANISIMTKLGLLKWQSFICFLIGFIVAALINWPIRWILVKITSAILGVVL